MNGIIVIVSLIVAFFLILIGGFFYFMYQKNKWKYDFIIHDPDFNKYSMKKACVITDKVNPENKYFKVKDYEAMELPFRAHTSEISGRRCWDTVKLPTGNLAYVKKIIKTELITDENGKPILDNKGNKQYKPLLSYELETIEKEQLANAYMKKCRNHDESDPYRLFSMIVNMVLILLVCITLIIGWYYQNKISDNFQTASKILAETNQAMIPVYTENTQTLEIIAQNLALWTGKNYTKNFSRTIDAGGSE